MSERKLLVVDGSNLLFQMYFGMPSRIFNKEGKGIWATLGFTGALLKIIRLTNPTHVVVLFDSEHENPRVAIDQQYKANRIDYSEVDENPFTQLPDIYKVLDYLKLQHCETVDCETDDVAASYALSYGPSMKVVISSFDSDFFQLITDNVSVLRYRGEKSMICDTKWFLDKFGIQPSQYADFKSLTGDSADNIKGAEKVGPKTAASLILEFGSLDTVLENVTLIRKPTIKASIQKARDRLLINRVLIKLDSKASLPFEIEKLGFIDNGITTTEVLKQTGLY